MNITAAVNIISILRLLLLLLVAAVARSVCNLLRKRTKKKKLSGWCWVHSVINDNGR